MTDYARDERADVNQDGRVDAADLLSIRDPANWGKLVRPAEPDTSGWTQYTYAAPLLDDGEPDRDASAYDVRTNRTIERVALTSDARGITADKYWVQKGDVNRLDIRDVDFNTHGYGLYSGVPNLTVERARFNATHRDPIRIEAGYNLKFRNGSCLMPEADVATRIHGDAYDIEFTDWDFYCWSWGADLGEQYRGAGGVVHHVTFKRCRFFASQHTIHAVRIRAQHVKLVDCHGIGFDKAQDGATFATVERHSCDPIGAVLEGCSVDGGKPLLKSKWTDTEVR